MTSTQPSGRREQHRADVLRRARDAARELFESQGFAHTTVREIAERAGINERTFYRFFPSKEDLVLDEVRELIPSLSATLLARPDDEPPLTAIQNSLAVLAAHTSVPLTILVTGVPNRDEPVTKPRRALLIDFEDQLARDLAQRYSDTAGFTPLDASVISRAAFGAIRAALLEHTRTRREGRAVPIGEALARAFATLKRLGG